MMRVWKRMVFSGKPATNFIENYINACTVLAHMDGANNGTSFTATRGGDFTAMNGAVISTEQKLFGTAALKFDGVDDYFKSNYAGDAFSFQNRDFCIEIAIYPTVSDGASRGIYGMYSGGSPFGLMHKNGSFYMYQKAVSPTFMGGTVLLNQWSWITLQRKSGVITLAVNGVKTGVNINVGGVTINGSDYSNNPLCLGGIYSFFGDKFQGYLDEFCVINGNAKYSGDSIIVPTQAISLT